MAICQRDFRQNNRLDFRNFPTDRLVDSFELPFEQPCDFSMSGATSLPQYNASVAGQNGQGDDIKGAIARNLFGRNDT